MIGVARPVQCSATRLGRDPRYARALGPGGDGAPLPPASARFRARGAEGPGVHPHPTVRPDPGDRRRWLPALRSVAIVDYVAQSRKLLPASLEGRALAAQWSFAAVNSVEPALVELFVLDHFAADQAWARSADPLVTQVQSRLAALDEQLAGRAYLLGDEFSAPYIPMTHVLRLVQHTNRWAPRRTSTPTSSAARRGPPGGRWLRSITSVSPPDARGDAGPRRLGEPAGPAGLRARQLTDRRTGS